MAEEKSTTTLNKARVEDLLGYIKQTFYSQAEHEQGIKDFNAWWLSVLGQPNGVPKTDANNKILQGFFPDYILGQLLWGGTIAGNDKISPSTHLSSKIDIVDESITNGNVAKYTGIYFIATADANTSGSIVNSLDVRTGDWVISTGVEWVKIDNTDAVRSVADYVGSITAEELRNRLVAQYKDGETYKNFALGTMHYADGSGKASQLTTTEFARSILGGIASQSVFSGLYADKAKTLLTPRKLWGRSFDGSDDVYGDLELNKGRIFTADDAKSYITLFLDKTYGLNIGSETSPHYNTSIWGKDIKFVTGGNGQVRLAIFNSGNVAIGVGTDRGYKLDVNGTFNANGATTLNSTLLVKDLATFEKNILLANANTIGFKHTDGQSNINLLSLTQNNEALFGYGTIAKGLVSTIYGKEIQFKTKDSLNNDAIIDDNGNFHSYHDISATGGVSARGVNDFGIGGGSVGTGGKTYKLIKVDGVTNTTLQLEATDGSQTETVRLDQFSNSFAGLVPATNGASKTNVLSTAGWRALEANDIPNLDWSKIATGKPTTLGGYGITDAYTKSQIANGVFPSMRVGLADDLGDIEETLDEEYTFQPTANPNEIRDGYAQIESLKGNSVVWNQLMKKQKERYSVIEEVGEEIIITPTDIANNRYMEYIYVTQGHKYLQWVTINTNGENVRFINYQYLLNNPEYNVSSTSYVLHYEFVTATTSGDALIQLMALTQTSYSIKKGSFNLFDLTQMFGAGNEPTTLEEFYARVPKGVSMDYNEGEIINLTADAVKSVGFNQWDEEWEVGVIINETGLNYDGDTTRIRSINKTRVIPDMAYWFHVPNRYGELYAYRYNSEGQYIGGSPIRVDNRAVVFDNDVSFIRIGTYSAVVTTYTNDICINLSDPDKNGTYEPYTEFRRELPTDLFEGGMKSAGTAHDEIYWDKAKGKYVKVTRIGKVDMGSLNWKYRASNSPNPFFIADVTGGLTKLGAQVMPNIIVPKRYNVVISGYDSTKRDDKSITWVRDLSAIMLYDYEYTDVNSLKASLQGVMFYYELAEPIVEEIDIPYMDYQVSNSGTEEIVSDVPTTPIKARVTYNFDTIGTVRQNRFDISNLKIDLKTSVASLENKMSLLAKGVGVSGNWVLDGLKIGTYDVLHKGNTSLVIDSGDNFGFTLKVADTEIQMSDITEDELREMINTAWGTNYEA